MTGNLFCPHRTADDVDPKILILIARLEEICGFQFFITRGCYCPECNARVGGTTHSAHMKESHKSSTGKAIDISISDNHQRFMIVKAAILLGVSRIEDRDTWVHLDIGLIDDGFAQQVMF